MTSDMLHLIRTAFIAGIANTRECFNGECLFEHLAPRRLVHDDVGRHPDIKDVFESPAVQRLANEYVESHGKP
jgi:hypothetical protein